MDIYTDYAYHTGELYANESRTGFIGIEDSQHAPVLPRIRMILRLIRRIRFSRVKSLLGFIRQIEGANEEYVKMRHLDVLMVAVDSAHQGKGIATELVAFAKQEADTKGSPLLIDTDMEPYAKMYEHLGCELYHTVTADNGVTRYSLVYNKPKTVSESRI